MLFGSAGASTELRLVIKGDGTAAIHAVGDVDKAVGKTTRSTANWGRQARIAGLAIAAGIGAATAAYTKCLSAAAAYDEEFTKMLTLFRGAPEDIVAMKDELLMMESAVPPVERLTASYNILSAGFRESAGMMEIYTVAQEGAIGGSASLNSVVLALTKSMNAYGAEENQAREYMDILNGTIVAGQTRMSELAGSIGRVTGIAKELGISFAELNAMIGAATLTLGSNEEATTAVLGVLNAAIKPSKELSDIMGKNALQAMGLRNWLIKLFDAVEGDVEALGRLIPNVRGLTGLLAIGKNDAEAFDAALGLINDSSGITKENFDKMNATFAVQWKHLKNNITVIKTLIGSGGVEGGGLVGVNEALRELIQYLHEHPDELASLARMFEDIAQAAAWATRTIVTAAHGIRLLREDAARVVAPVTEAYQRWQFKTEGGFRKAIPPQWGGKSMAAPGLMGLPAEFREEWGLGAADMGAEFGALYAVIAQLHAGSKKGSDFRRVLEGIATELSGAQRKAEGFTSAAQAQVETMVRLGTVTEAAGDALLKVLIPWERLNEAAQRQQWLEDIENRLQEQLWTMQEEGRQAQEADIARWIEDEKAFNLALADQVGIRKLLAQAAAEQAAQEMSIRVSRALDEQMQWDIAPGQPIGLGGKQQWQWDAERAEIEKWEDVQRAMAEEGPIVSWYDMTEQISDVKRDWSDLTRHMERSMSRAFARMIVDGEFKWRSLLDAMAEQMISSGITRLISGQAAAPGRSKWGSALSIGLGLINPWLGMLGGVLDFDNPINDAWARREGERFSRFVREGVERQGAAPATAAEPSRTVNITNYISAQPANTRELSRALTRRAERLAW